MSLKLEGLLISWDYCRFKLKQQELYSNQFNIWNTKYKLLSSIDYEAFKLALNRLSEAERRINPTDRKDA